MSIEEEEEEEEGQELVEKPEDAIWDLHHKHLDSDLCESTPGVDTDGEFLPTDPSSDSSGDEFQKPPAVGNPAAGDDAGARGPRGHRKHLYDNNYFYIIDNEGNADVKDVNILIHRHWTSEPPLGLGRANTCSRTLTPAHYGETRLNPVRSFLLLRAWMIWRATQDGWAARAPGRSRIFVDEAVRLERDIRRIQPQPDGILGHRDATRKLEAWVPDIVARLRG